MKNKNQNTFGSECIRFLKNGDIKTFEKLFFLYSQPLITFANRMLCDTPVSENIVQDVFLYIWINKEKLDPELNLKSYLYTSVRNQALRQIRHAGVKEKHSKTIKQLIQPEKNPEEQLLDMEITDSIKIAVDELPERCGLIFSMNRFDHLTYNEIAEILNLSVKTVETQMGRALKYLRKRLAHFLSIFPC